jgi:hypothetical protein
MGTNNDEDKFSVDAVTLTVDTWKSGSITSTKIEQWYEFTATSDYQYVHIKCGTIDGVIVQLFETDGTALGDGISFGVYANDYYSFSVISGKKYYLKVLQRNFSLYIGSFSDTGTYQIAFNASGITPD